MAQRPFVTPSHPTHVHQAETSSDALELQIPRDDECDPEVSLVIPAVDEQLTVAEFVHWCKEGLRDSGIRGEVLIVDSSDDETSELALDSGARVLKTPRRGLGRAYIDSLPYIRGRYVIMGDADCTYDFRQLGRFVEKFHEGWEFVMGSRWRGQIEPGSMPVLHRYVGTPLTTWIMNRLYSSKFSDIHCGMRGITREALYRMGLTSQSWEYASEMVLKSVRMELRTTEVPVTFFKDPDGRVSHHRRSGWSSPVRAAWTNLQAMFVYGADYFLLKPGAVFLTLGLLLTVPLTFGDFSLGPVHFSLSWMLLGVTLVLLGMQSVYFGCLAQVLCDYTGRRRLRWLLVFRYTRTVVVSGIAFIVGVGLAATLIVRYVSQGLSLPASSSSDITYHLAVTGLMLMIAGFSTFAFALLIRATAVRYGAGIPVAEDGHLRGVSNGEVSNSTHAELGLQHPKLPHSNATVANPP